MRNLKTKSLKDRCVSHCVSRGGDADQGLRLFNALMSARAMLDSHRNLLEFCPCCDQPVHDVETSYNVETSVRALSTICRWARDHGRHEFAAKEVKHLLDHTQYANLNHLDRFAGIVYRPKGKPRGWYGLNLQRADAFFRGETTAPVRIVTNRLTGERVATEEKFIHDFPKLADFLDEDGVYHPAPIPLPVPPNEPAPAVHYPNN